MIIQTNQVAEEKANARESSYKEQIKTLTSKLKQEINNQHNCAAMLMMMMIVMMII